MKNGEQSTDLVSVSGRVMSKRASGNKLIFYDLYQVRLPLFSSLRVFLHPSAGHASN